MVVVSATQPMEEDTDLYPRVAPKVDAGARGELEDLALSVSPKRSCTKNLGRGRGLWNGPPRGGVHRPLPVQERQGLVKVPSCETK